MGGEVTFAKVIGGGTIGGEDSYLYCKFWGAETTIGGFGSV